MASLFIDFSASGTSFTVAQSLLFPPLSISSSRATIVVCHSSSSSSKHIPAASNNPQQQQSASDGTNLPHLLPPRNPNSTWPKRPSNNALSLQRQRPHRINPPTLADLKLLSLVNDKLNSFHLSEDVDDASALSSFFRSLDDAFPLPPTRGTALFLLDSLRPWHKAYRFFQWLKSGSFFPMGTIFYNTTMKALRFGRWNDLVLCLAEEMVDIGIDLDNITYSIVITAAKHRRQHHVAMRWFERMSETGLIPDPVTYSAMLDVYARVGAVGQAMSLFERGRASGWTPDPLAFAMLLRMFGEAGDSEGIVYVRREMKNLGLEPDVLVYNALLEGLGKAGNPRAAQEEFEQMLTAGLAPNEKTLTTLLSIYGKAKWNRDALKLWELITLNKWPVNSILCNVMLVQYVPLGLVFQAEDLFTEMKASEDCRPNSVGYTAMVSLYAAAHQCDKALQIFEEMLKQGLRPTGTTVTCLIQCYGKAGRLDDAIRLFDVAMRRGIRPDDQLRCSLLSVIATCQEAEMNKVLACLDEIGPRYVKLIRLLSSEDVQFRLIREEFRAILNEAHDESRKPICNCFIDMCRNQNFPTHRAQELFSFGVVYGLYPNLHSETYDEWSLDLSSLSDGAAYTAFEDWVSILAGKINTDGALPQLFSVHTGAEASHESNPTGAFASYLKELAAPFRQTEKRSAHFTATREELVSWMQARASPVPSDTSGPIVSA